MIKFEIITNRHWSRLLLRIFVFTALCILFCYFLWGQPNYLRLTYTGVALLLAGIELVRYFNRLYGDFNSFLLSLLQEDFTLRFKVDPKKEGNTGVYYETLNLITQKFRDISLAKEEEHQFLSMLIKQMNVGIIVITDKQEITMVNDAFLTITNQKVVNSIQSIERRNKGLAQILTEIKAGEVKLLKMEFNRRIRQLSLHASAIKTNTGIIRLITIQDIRQELDRNEWDSWQKLIRVLTHEIMNSVTPISSLSDTLLYMDSSATDWNNRVQIGLEAIKNRSEGLLKFTNTYRELTKIPLPHFEQIQVKSLFEMIIEMYSGEVEKDHLKINYELSDHELEVLGDKEMLERILINLIKNGIEASNHTGKIPSILLRGFKGNDGKLIITIQDNGNGIAEEIRDQIFIPFFTTKKEGSGIGLSLCRQMALLHGGTLNLDSTEFGTIATFTI